MNIIKFRIFLILFSLVLSFNLLSTKPGEPGELVEESKELLPRSLDLSQQVVNFAQRLDKGQYENLVYRVSDKASTQPVFASLLELLTQPMLINGDLPVKYFDGYKRKFKPNFMVEQSDFMFHGTRALLDILAAGMLKAHASMSGRYIYFGHDFTTSSQYTSDKSSNIHKTWKLGKTRAVMVFAKHVPPGARLWEKEYLAAGKEYELHGTDNYLLEGNLLTIVLMSKDDVDNYSRYFASIDPVQQALLKKVSLYGYDYRPIQIEQHSLVIKNYLDENYGAIFSDVDFLTYLIEQDQFGVDDQFLLNLCENLAQQNLLTDLYKPLLAKAAENNAVKAVAYLAQQVAPEVFLGTVMSKPDEYGSSIIGNAAINNLQSLVEEMFKPLATRPELMAQLANHLLAKKDNKSILTEVVSNGHFEMVNFLTTKLDYLPDAKFDAAEIEREMVVGAMHNKRFDVIVAMAKNKQEILTLSDDNGIFPLMAAAISDDVGSFEALLQANESMLVKKDESRENNIAHAAAEKNGNMRILQIIIDRAPELLFELNRFGDTPAHLAAQSSLSALKLIIKSAPDTIKVKNKNGRTPVGAANIAALAYLNHINMVTDDDFDNVLEQAIFKTKKHRNNRYLEVLQEIFPDYSRRITFKARRAGINIPLARPVAVSQDAAVQEAAAN